MTENMEGQQQMPQETMDTEKKVENGSENADGIQWVDRSGMVHSFKDRSELIEFLEQERDPSNR